MFRKILVPTDGSDFARHCTAAAVRFAASGGAELVAVSLVQPLASIPFYEGVGVVDAGADQALIRQARERAEAAVAALKAEAAAAGVACTTEVRDADSLPHGIVDAASAHGCDLIFIGSHGRRGLTQVLLGSVTKAVLPIAHIPVLVWRE